MTEKNQSLIIAFNYFECFYFLLYKSSLYGCPTFRDLSITIVWDLCLTVRDSGQHVSGPQLKLLITLFHIINKYTRVFCMHNCISKTPPPLQKNEIIVRNKPKLGKSEKCK